MGPKFLSRSLIIRLYIDNGYKDKLNSGMLQLFSSNKINFKWEFYYPVLCRMYYKNKNIIYEFEITECYAAKLL